MKPLSWFWTLLVSVGLVSIVAAGYALRFSLHTIGLYSLSFYGVFAISHFVLQMVFASLNKDRWRGASGYQPTVSVIVPTYKEDPELLRSCLLSIKRQDYPAVAQVVLSNDGDDTYIHDIFQEVADSQPGWVYLQNGHNGKRVAMYRAFGVATSEVLVNIDSDTVMAPGAITELIQPLGNPEVGCVTGNVRVLNASQNLLTRITDLRYWLAFNLERAAQSYFGVMTCVAGPLGAYRRSIIEEVKDRWVNQRFLGNICTYGDDRHLTNLVLVSGFKSVYAQQARADTEAPDHILRWSQQQLRWFRSFIREFLISIKTFPRHHPWLAYDLTYQFSFPLFLAANVGIILYQAVTDTAAFLGLWVGLLIFFGLLRSTYGVAFTRSPRFLFFTGYGLLYVAILLPLKFYGLATVWKTTWGTTPRNDK